MSDISVKREPRSRGSVQATPSASDDSAKETNVGISTQGDGAETEGNARQPLGLRGALEIIGLVAAPTTLITAVAFYFGWTFSNSRAAYFGIDYSTLGFSSADYLLRSGDALFVPLLVILLVSLAGLVLHAVVMRWIDEGRRPAVRRGAQIGGAIGLVIFVYGAVTVFRPAPFPTHYLLSSVSLGVGISLLTYAPFVVQAIGVADEPALRRPRPVLQSAAVTLVVLVVVLSIFWASSQYASALGRGRAQNLERSLSSRPAVVVFSRQALGIDAQGVTVTRITEPESAYRFRYSGLRLLIRSGGKFFLLPNGWSRAQGVAIVLADTEDIRLEFSPGR
jgi:hypothetical protein